MSRTEQVVAWLFDRRWALALALLGLTALAVLPAMRVGVENRLEVWFLDDDPALASYRAFQEAFGGEETVVVALHREEGVLDAEGQRLLVEATRALQGVPGVHEVRSLATVPQVETGPAGLKVAPLLPAAEVEDTEALRARILADAQLVGRLVSADGRTGLLLVRLEALPDLDARRPELLAALEARLQALKVEYHLGGNGVVYAALNQASTVDSAALLGAAYVLMALLLWGVYRRVGPVLVTLGAVLMAVVWTVGLMGLAGRNITVVTLVVPTLVLIIGVADCVHLLRQVAEQPEGGGQRLRVVRGMAGVIWPCLFNTLTSSAGFLALLTSPMPVIRDLGLFCAAGLLCAFLTSVVVCTWALGFRGAEPRAAHGDVLQRGASALAALAARRSRLVLAGAAGLAILLGGGMLRLEVDTHSLGTLSEAHRARRDSDWIERHFGPYLPLEFLVRTEGGAPSPQLLEAVERWQRATQAEGKAGWSSSVVDALTRLSPQVTGVPGLPKDPATLAALTALYQQHAPQDFAAQVDGTTLRVTFGIPMQSARGIERSIRDISALAALPAGARVEPSGYLPLYVQMMEHLVSSQVDSFAVAFVVVFLLIALLLRSVRLTLLAIPANVLPVLGVLGVMGLSGVPLDASTITISALVLGLVVDDTIHFLYRLREEEKKGEEGAVDRTLQSVGASMVATGLVLALGFSVLGLAEVTTVAYFGLLLALAMGAALLADLLVTPALVEALRKRAGAKVTEASADLSLSADG